MASAQRSMDSHSDQGKRIIAAAAERNKDPILEVLKTHLPSATASRSPNKVLEIASGTGQHSAYFSETFTNLVWQPTEAAEECFESIKAWGEDRPNVLPPLLLNAASPADSWPVDPQSCVAMLCVNMTHISPWASTEGLLAGAGRVLASGGQLLLYGPFKVDGKPTTESNAAFDRSLRAQNPLWGLRDVSEVDACATAAGMKRVEMMSMPANNFTLIYVKE